MQTTEALTAVPGAAKEGRLRGFIKQVKDQGAYGFIRTDGGADYFFHHVEFPGGKVAKVGQTVEFTPIANTVPGKAARALRIEVLA